MELDISWINRSTCRYPTILLEFDETRERASHRASEHSSANLIQSSLIIVWLEDD